MAQIDVGSVMNLCMREGILSRPHNHEKLPDGTPPGPSEMMVEELTELLEIYKETPSISNYSKIENMLFKFDETPEYSMELIMREFSLDKPREYKKPDKADEIDFFDDYNQYELEQINQAKSTLKETRGKSTKTTVMQLSGVAAAMIGLYGLTSNGSIGHDLAMGTIAATGMLIGTAAILTDKGIRGVVKLGTKGLGLAFKAVKGTAQAAMDKAAKKSEKRKIINSMKQAKEGKAISEQIVEIAERDLENSLITDEVKNSLDEETANKFQKMRDGNIYVIDELQEELTQKSSKEMTVIRNQLYTIKNSKVVKTLLKSGLSQEDVLKVIENTKLNEEGELELPNDVGITLDEIEELGLTNILEKNVQMPRIDELSDAQVIEIAKHIQIEDGKISYAENEAEKMDDEVKEILEGVSGTEYYSDTLKPLQERISVDIEQHEVTSKVLKEVQARNKVLICQDLDEQMTVILNEITKINAKSVELSQSKSEDVLSRREKHTRESLRKLAEKKVKTLEKAGIVETLERGRKRERRVIDDAEKILTPDLEKTEKIGEKRIERTAEDQELDY